MKKISLTEYAGRNFTNGFFGPEKFRDFRETGPRVIWKQNIDFVWVQATKRIRTRLRYFSSSSDVRLEIAKATNFFGFATNKFTHKIPPDVKQYRVWSLIKVWLPNSCNTEPCVTKVPENREKNRLQAGSWSCDLLIPYACISLSVIKETGGSSGCFGRLPVDVHKYENVQTRQTREHPARGECQKLSINFQCLALPSRREPSESLRVHVYFARSLISRRN